MKLRSVRVELLHADRQTDRQSNCCMRTDRQTVELLHADRQAVELLLADDRHDEANASSGGTAAVADRNAAGRMTGNLT